MEIASHKGYNDWKNEVNLCQFCKSSQLKFDDVTRPRLLVTDHDGLWCCNILMLMSWLSPQSPVSRCHLWYWPILLNTEHNESEWLWQMSSSSTDHNTAPTPSHTRRSQGSQFPSDSNFWFKNYETQTWNDGLTLFLKTQTIVCDVWLGVIAIVKDYSWLSRDNKRRRGANTQAWQTQ